MDRWFSLEQFQITRHKPRNLKQGDRFFFSFFFFSCAQRYTSLGAYDFLSTSPSAARQVCRQRTGYNSSQQFLTSKKEKGREGFKIHMLRAPELKLQMDMNKWLEETGGSGPLLQDSELTQQCLLLRLLGTSQHLSTFLRRQRITGPIRTCSSTLSLDDLPDNPRNFVTSSV